MIIYETSNWMPRCWYIYQRPCRTKYNPDYYSRDQSKCRMADITTPNTMPITMPNTMPNLSQSYIIENTIPKEVPTQTPRSRATQLWWQLTTTNRLWNQPRMKPFQSIFPTKPYEISRQWSNDSEKRGMTVPESQPLPQTITVLEVPERSTVRYIHQLRRPAAACAPGNEWTSGLRERR